MRVSSFVGVSLDGFLARDDGSLDYLTAFGGEDHGYDDFLRSVGAVVLGRATYDAVCAFDAWPFPGKRVVVLTHRPIAARHGETTHQGSLAPLLAELAGEAIERVYLDGGVAIRQALDEDLLDDLTLSTVPVLIGSGRRLFGGAPRTTPWTLTALRSFPSGLVQAHYERRR